MEQLVLDHRFLLTVGSSLDGDKECTQLVNDAVRRWGSFQVFLEKFGSFITHTDIYSLIAQLSYFFFPVGILFNKQNFESFSSCSLERKKC